MATYDNGIYEAPRGTYDNLAFGWASIVTQIIGRGGLAITSSPASVYGEQIDVSRPTVLRVVNASAASITVSPQPRWADQCGNPSLPTDVPVAPGATKLIGPFPASHYRQADGLMSVLYSSAASVTVAAMQIAPD